MRTIVRTIKRLPLLLILPVVLAALVLPARPAPGAAPLAHGDALLFVENVGQFPDTVLFQVLGLGEPFWITRAGLIHGSERLPMAIGTASGLLRHEARLSYYAGPTAASWYEAVPVWGGVRLTGVWSDADLVLLGRQGRLGYVWWRDGGAVTQTPDGAIVAAWLASTDSAGEVGAQGLIFSTFLGADAADEAAGVAQAADGDVVVAGTTYSTVFPGPDGSVTHGVDVVVARFAPDGSSLRYALHINPPDLNAPDYGMALALDVAGNAYVTGRAESAGFPTTPGAYDTSYNGNSDAFALKIDAAGDLVYSTFLGGGDLDLANGVAVDANGSALVAGSTWSTDFITNTVGAADARSAFVARLTADGSALIGALRMGGTGQDEATAVAWDGQAWQIGGWTNSADWPLAGTPLQATYGGATDGFVARLALDTLTPIYSGYLGGAGEDRVWAVAAVGETLLAAGMTRSDDFPTSADAFDAARHADVCAWCADGFLVRLSGSGATLSYGTYFGGAGEDWAEAIATTPEGGALVTGLTESEDFPVLPGAFDETLGGERDAFLLRLETGGAGLTYGSYLGGTERDEGLGLWSAGESALVAGRTESADFPISAGAYDVTHNGDADVFITLLGLGEVPGPAGGRLYLPAALR